MNLQDTSPRTWSIESLGSTALTTLVGLSLLGFGCAKDPNKAELTVQDSIRAIPKVDILLGQGHSEALMEINDALATQVPAFLTALSTTEGWNLHFTSTGLNTPVTPTHPAPPITQIAVSHPSSSEPVLASLQKSPANYSSFITSKSISPRPDDKTTGLNAILDALTAQTTDTGFLRADALTEVWAITAQEDTSGTHVCTTPSNQSIPCDATEEDKNVNQSSLASYRQKLPQTKSTPSAFRFHAFVSSITGDCKGHPATAGTRYVDLANSTQGLAVDLCAGSPEQFLAAMKASLSDLRSQMETEYLFLDDEAVESTIEVFKGDTKLSKSEQNGWMYVGQVKNVYEISAPVPLNLRSGIAIRLLGSAKLKGDETAKVVYQTPEQFARKRREIQ